MAPSLSGQSCNMKTAVLAGSRAKVELFQVLYFNRPARRDMTEWTLLKRLLDAVHQHSTMIGRLWLTIMVIFRLLIVAVATEDVYTDEQEMFVCNTLQPGCPNVCYDAFAPISQPRFWVFQIITVSTPSLCFIIYTWHNLSKQPECEQIKEALERSCDSESCSIKSHKHLNPSLEGITNQKPSQASKSSSGVLSKYYIFHVCFRTILEVAFVVAQWLLFGFRVPTHFICTSSPCMQRVDCYVSRPTEKTVFLIFMFCVGVFCIFLNFLELNHLAWKMIKKSVLVKDGSWKGYGAINQDSQSIASLTFKDVPSTTSLPTLDLVVDHQPDWICTANCSTKKDNRGTQSKPKTNRKSKQRSTEVWI
ncbi:gap junction protein delta 6 [Danio aesculapii]|uniref:gap junction protein delta 6 n=1 Tax=Danio aesculapii TaxID=1142201 RepID=UPI0024C05DA8|nr:gap junction protein delta 6 [Danio aesculapii]